MCPSNNPKSSASTYLLAQYPTQLIPRTLRGSERPPDPRTHWRIREIPNQLLGTVLMLTKYSQTQPSNQSNAKLKVHTYTQINVIWTQSKPAAGN